MKYPVTAATFVTQEDIDAGRTCIRYDYKELVTAINDAFYTGFLVALCKSKEEWDNLSIIDRMEAAALAKDLAATFYR